LGKIEEFGNLRTDLTGFGIGAVAAAEDQIIAFAFQRQC